METGIQMEMPRMGMAAVEQSRFLGIAISIMLKLGRNHEQCHEVYELTQTDRALTYYEAMRQGHQAKQADKKWVVAGFSISGFRRCDPVGAFDWTEKRAGGKPSHSNQCKTKDPVEIQSQPKNYHTCTPTSLRIYSAETAAFHRDRGALSIV